MLSQKRADDLTEFQQALGYAFKNPSLLNKALTHKSYANEKKKGARNNERLEFLGDSVLDLIVSNYLVNHYDDLKEGALSKIRASVVNETCLAGLARSVNLGRYLLLGKGEENSGGREKASLLANAYEAVCGAIFRDSDFKTASAVLLPSLKTEIQVRAEMRAFRDYKSDLQELTQNKLQGIPTYRVAREIGPDHEKQFEVVVLVKNKVRGKGAGRSKKEAEQAAAREALAKIN